jgi:hypothetical protein
MPHHVTTRSGKAPKGFMSLRQMRQSRRYPVPHRIGDSVQPPGDFRVDLVDLGRRHKFGKPLNFGNAFRPVRMQIAHHVAHYGFHPFRVRFAWHFRFPSLFARPPSQARSARPAWNPQAS